jgi:hypothetical protein
MKAYVWTTRENDKYVAFANDLDQAMDIMVRHYGQERVEEYLPRYKLTVQPMPEGLYLGNGVLFD